MASFQWKYTARLSYFWREFTFSKVRKTIHAPLMDYEPFFNVKCSIWIIRMLACRILYKCNCSISLCAEETQMLLCDVFMCIRNYENAFIWSVYVHKRLLKSIYSLCLRAQETTEMHLFDLFMCIRNYRNAFIRSVYMHKKL